MSSLRARIFNVLLKHRHWLRLKVAKPSVDQSTSVPDLRRQADRVATMLARVPEGIEVSPIRRLGVRGERLHAQQGDCSSVILYLHGGCYVMGSAAARRGFVARLVRGSGIDALSLDYRLAPEDPFPAALDDTVAAYEDLLEQGVLSSRIVLAGDSAGGGLCLATLLALRDRGRPMPAAAVAISPWVDLACTTHDGKDPVVADGSWEVFGRYYAGDRDLRDPLISPLYGDLTGLPPLHISVGDDEVLLDEVRLFADKAGAAAVKVTLRVEQGMVHIYPLFTPWVPEATRALAEIIEFIGEHVPPKSLD